MSTEFERFMLAAVVKEARKHGAIIKDAWIHNTCLQWEFHYKNFYWHGRCENAYDARAKGWEAWIKDQEKLKLKS